MRLISSFRFYLFISLSAFYVSTWVLLNALLPQDSSLFDYFSDTYGSIAALGGILGIFSSHQWGGFKSLLGKSLLLFSFGLLFQFFGQVSYAIYYYGFGIENAYPSIGDLFYFGSIPLYILALHNLFMVLQIKYSIHSWFKRLVSFLIPLILVVISYCMFLRDYSIDPSAPLTTFLDFGFPLGASIFIGMTLIAYLFSSSTLGGKLKPSILLLFFSLLLQYSADTMYLVHTIRDTWRAGGIDDFLYLISYSFMGYTLLSFGNVAESLLNCKSGEKA